jgi:hypothetical protein
MACTRKPFPAWPPRAAIITDGRSKLMPRLGDDSLSFFSVPHHTERQPIAVVGWSSTVWSGRAARMRLARGGAGPCGLEPTASLRAYYTNELLFLRAASDGSTLMRGPWEVLSP